jgi:hypothetical protein
MPQQLSSQDVLRELRRIRYSSRKGRRLDLSWIARQAGYRRESLYRAMNRGWIGYPHGRPRRPSVADECVTWLLSSVTASDRSAVVDRFVDSVRAESPVNSDLLARVGRSQSMSERSHVRRSASTATVSTPAAARARAGQMTASTISGAREFVNR